MSRRRARSLGSEPEVHGRQLVSARHAVRVAAQVANNRLDKGDCAGADSELRRGAYFEGQASVHFDATVSLLEQGEFRNSTEARALAGASKRFHAACVRGRIKKGS